MSKYIHSYVGFSMESIYGNVIIDKPDAKFCFWLFNDHISRYGSYKLFCFICLSTLRDIKENEFSVIAGTNMYNYEYRLP